MAITDKQIFSAAEALELKGINPSQSSVREELGGGSIATIAPVLRQWKEDREERTRIYIAMPEEAKATIERLGTEVWKMMSNIATEKQKIIKLEASTRVSDAHTERDENLKEMVKLEEELKQSKQTNQQTLSSLEEAHTKIRALEIKEAATGKIETELELAREKINNLMKENGMLLGQLKTMETQNKNINNTINNIPKNKKPAPRAKRD